MRVRENEGEAQTHLDCSTRELLCQVLPLPSPLLQNHFFIRIIEVLRTRACDEIMQVDHTRALHIVLIE